MTDQVVSRRILIYAAICGALGVLLGALGAHGLDAILESRGASPELIAKRLDQFDVAVRYHLVHSLALLALAAMPLGPPRRRRLISHLFLLGLILFSGSLYALVFSDVSKFGMITPLGGLVWIAAWLSLATLRQGLADSHPIP